MERGSIDAMMDRATSGDAAAFGTLSRLAQDEIYRLALALGLGAHDAAEVTQETFLRAYRDRSRWKRGSSVMAWLCGIAVNVTREFLRRERRASAWIRQTLQELSGVVPHAVETHGPLDSDQLQHLAVALDGLPARQREAVACRYLRQMSIRDTAVAMGCAEGTVKSCIAAALEKLQTVLEYPHETK